MSALFLPEDVIRRDERLQELLCDHAIHGLDPHEQQELERAMGGRRELTPSFEHTAALVHLACVRPTDVAPLPEPLRDKLARAGEQWCMGRRADAETKRAPLSFAAARDAQARVAARGAGSSMMPWLIAAAAAIAAVVGWMPRDATIPTSNGGTQVAARVGPNAARTAMLAAPPQDLVRVSWSDWDKPEVAGVRGEVVWSDARQAGYLSFENLPTLDPSRECYQLWIIDSRGMEQRISGGIFHGATGELVVPIDPAIRVVGAAAFAITIERPEGTWVSDMKRRVVIAAKPS